MVDISAIAGMMTALKGAKDIATAMKDLRDGALIQGKVIELNEKILDAQSSAFAAQDERATLVARIGQLEKELAGLKAWDAEKQRYELKDLGDGAMAYSLKETVHGYGPPHQICANCYDEGHKSILQKYTSDVGRRDYFACNVCGATVWPDGGGPDHLNSKSRSGPTTFGRARK